MERNTQHVVPALDGRWAVRRGGAPRATRLFDTQQEAVAWARKMCQDTHSELVVHKPDGTILRKDACGHSPDLPQ